MSQPIINILIRSHRPDKFDTCIQSVQDDDYHVKVSIYIQTEVDDKSQPFFYNLYCNVLKDDVDEGYFFFLDDDDTIIPGAISKIAPHLTPEKPVICQMLRAGKPKPSMNVIARGHIGLPCMILHHSHKHLADVTARESGDYDWIKAVTDKLGYTWVEIPLVNSPKRSFGK